MNPLAVLLSAVLLVGAAFAQFPPNFSSSFQGGFQGFNGFGSFQLVGAPAFQSGSGRSNAGTTVQGPILFPPAPTSRETSGVVVGASGYGFVPPGTSEIMQGRGFQPPNQVQSALRQSFGNYFTI